MANLMKPKTQKIAEPFSDKVLDVITTIVLLCLLVAVGYPVVYTISCSISSADALNTGRVYLWPVGFSINGYRFVMQYKQFFTSKMTAYSLMAASWAR